MTYTYRYIFTTMLNCLSSSELFWVIHLMAKCAFPPAQVFREKPGKPIEARTSPQRWLSKTQHPAGHLSSSLGRMRKDHRAGYPPSVMEEHHQDLLQPPRGASALPAQPNQGVFPCSEVKRVEKGWASSYRVVFFFFSPCKLKPR